MAIRKPMNPHIEEVVMSLLARDPSSRPGDPAHLLADIRDLRDGAVTAEIVLPGVKIAIREIHDVLAQVVDPLVAALFANEQTGIRRIHDGQVLCHQDERSHHAFVLIRGAVRIRRDNVDVTRIDREGEFLGEIAALTGEPRNASMIADGDVWVRVLNAAQLEALVANNPALGVRLIRSMANRFRYTR